MFYMIVGYDIVMVKEDLSIVGTDYLVNLVKYALKTYGPWEGDMYLYLQQYFQSGEGKTLVKDSIIDAQKSLYFNAADKNIIY